MIFVIIAICIALLIAGVLIYENTNAEDFGITMGIIGGIVGFSALIACVFMLCSFNSCVGLDERIAMYEEENTKIETQIATVVEQYQKYETDIFTEVKPESSMTLISLYPELKSDSLVQKQIEVYVENSSKIKELKEALVTSRYLKWWLYFGG